MSWCIGMSAKLGVHLSRSKEKRGWLDRKEYLYSVRNLIGIRGDQ